MQTLCRSCCCCCCRRCILICTLLEPHTRSRLETKLTTSWIPNADLSSREQTITINKQFIKHLIGRSACCYPSWRPPISFVGNSLLLHPSHREHSRPDHLDPRRPSSLSSQNYRWFPSGCGLQASRAQLVVILAPRGSCQNSETDSEQQ